MSFKVICIDNTDRPGYIPHELRWNIEVGKKYTVANIFNKGKITSYELYEDPMNWLYSWDATHFIPISSIDENTFERNYQKETV